MCQEVRAIIASIDAANSIVLLVDAVNYPHRSPHGAEVASNGTAVWRIAALITRSGRLGLLSLLVAPHAGL